MPKRKADNLHELVGQIGRYPEEAFVFVREGLNYAVERRHGAETQAHQLLARYLAENDLDWGDLVAQYHAGELDEMVAQAVSAAGGCEKLNRHVAGRELCWGLRDLAVDRWGLLARTVLEHWKVRSTGDFGRIVFAFIDQGLMQKQEGDRPEDFEDVYPFDQAFDVAFRLNVGSRFQEPPDEP